VRPPAGRCSATALLVATVLPALASLSIRGWRVGAATVAVDLALVVPLVAPGARTLLRLLPGLLAAASITWSTWLFGTGSGWSVPAASGARVLALIVPGALLLTSLDPARLGDELGQWFGLPARPVLAAVAALEQIEVLADDWRTITAARRSRGLGPGRSPVARARAAAAITVALLAGALRRAESTSDAMAVRGLGAVAHRTWTNPARWTRFDSVIAVVAVVLTATPLIGRFG
jgi:energy-coupling factor transporter transmembrane protein EcfT